MKNRSRLKEVVLRIAPFLVVALLVSFVFYPLFTGYSHFANGMVYSDYWQFNYPLKDWYREVLSRGELPFWTSLLGNGYPVFAEGQIGALYPPHLILFKIFPTHLAFNLNIFLHYLMAGLFTYIFLHYSVRTSKTASVLGAICFSLSGYFFTHVLFVNTILVATYLPLVLFLVERIVSNRNLKWSLGLALVFSLQVFAGHLEIFYYVVFASILFLAFLLFTKRSSGSKNQQNLIKSIVLFSLSLLLAIMVTLVQLVPTYELVQNSNRQSGYDIEYATSSRWPLNSLSMFVYPGSYEKLLRVDYHPSDNNYVNPYSLYGYVGFIPIVLVFVALALSRKRYVIVMGGILLIGLLYGVGRSTQLFTIMWETVPGLKMLRFPVKVLFVLELCLASLAALGLDFIIKKLSRSNMKKYVSVIGILIILVTFADLYINNAKRFRKLIETDYWIEESQAVDLIKDGLEDGKYRYYSTNTNNLEGKGVDRATQKSYQNLLPANFNLLARLPSSREYFTLFLARKSKFDDTLTSIDFRDNSLVIPDYFYDAQRTQSVKYFITDIPTNSDKYKLINTVDLSTNINHKIHLAGGDLQTIDVPVEKIYIYELSDYIPRVYFAESYETEKDPDALLDRVFSDDFTSNDLVILEEELPPRLDTQLDGLTTSNVAGKNEVSIASDTQNSIEIKVETDRDGFLVLHDTFYPGWKAYACNGKWMMDDGLDECRETKIYRANYAFRAVRVPKGEHAVFFQYKPKSFNWASKISLVAATFTVLGLLVLLSKPLKSKK